MAGNGVPLDAEKLGGIAAAYVARQRNLADERDLVSADLEIARVQQGLHPQAFKLVMRIRALEDGKREAFLRAFDDYRRLLNLDGQLDLFEEQQQGKAAG